MTFYQHELSQEFLCGECDNQYVTVWLTPDVLLGHLVEDHEYSTEEAEETVDCALHDAE